MSTGTCPKCGTATDAPRRGWSLAVRITAGLRLLLWAVAFGYAGLVCAGWFLSRFGNMDLTDQAGAAAAALAYLAAPLAVAFCLDRCLAAVADLLCPWGRDAGPVP